MVARIRIVLFLLLLIVVGIVVVMNWGFFFKRTVEGEVVDVARVDTNTAILSGTSARGAIPNALLFSFAVAIRDEKRARAKGEPSEIVTASSEDRQWMVVKPGLCAVAEFWPYPPWDLAHAGTYHNARLIKLSECRKDIEKPDHATMPTTPPTTPPPSN